MTNFDFSNRAYWIKKFYEFFIETDNPLASSCSAFKNLNRQYDKTNKQEGDLEYIFDISEWAENLQWPKTYAIWCLEFKKGNFSIIKNIIKSFSFFIFKLALVSFFIEFLYMSLQDFVPEGANIKFCLAIFVISLFLITLSKKLLFNIKTAIFLFIAIGVSVFNFYNAEIISYAKSNLSKAEQIVALDKQNLKENIVNNQQEVIQKQIETIKEEKKAIPQAFEAKNKYLNYVIIEIKKSMTSWQFPDTGKVKIKFKISKSGQLLSSKIIESSGYSIIEEFAIKSLKSAQPFKPFPSEITNSFVVITYTFDIKSRN